MNEISRFNQQLHPYDDGCSSQRVLEAIDEVLAGQHPVAKSRPLNLFRNLKVRKRLKYSPEGVAKGRRLK